MRGGCAPIAMGAHPLNARTLCTTLKPKSYTLNPKPEALNLNREHLQASPGQEEEGGAENQGGYLVLLRASSGLGFGVWGIRFRASVIADQP